MRFIVFASFGDDRSFYHPADLRLLRIERSLPESENQLGCWYHHFITAAIAQAHPVLVCVWLRVRRRAPTMRIYFARHGES